jgi:hypothetical protein
VQDREQVGAKQLADCRGVNVAQNACLENDGLIQRRLVVVVLAEHVEACIVVPY